MQKSVRPATAPDRHDERIGDELRRHLGLHRPTDDPPREQVHNGGKVQPAFGRPDIGEVSDPLVVWPLRRELPIEGVRRDDAKGAFATVFRKATTTRSCS
jgi:hypothetical protein